VLPRDQTLSGQSGPPAGESGAWRQRLADLALACAGSYAADEGACLREMAALLTSAPEGHARGLARPDPAALEALIAAGAGASAALAMLDGGEAGYLLSSGGNGQHMASVILLGNAEELTASGDTAALALVGALAMALADLAETPPLTPGRIETAPTRLN